MKHAKSLIAYSVIAFSAWVSPAFAGPDWAAIERGRTAKQAEQAEQAEQARAKEADCAQKAVGAKVQSQNQADARPAK